MKAAHPTIIAIAFAVVPAAAHAHVVLEKRQATVGQPYKAVFKVTHGCEGSPTVKVTVDIPEGVVAVKPMPKPGWQITTTKGAYAGEYKFYHGVTLKEGPKTITWSGGSLPDDYYDEFVVSAFIAAELKPDQSLAFTVRQDCEKGQMTWGETGPPEHQHHLKWPAPLLKLLPANIKPGD
jgi:periplasmic copper chaperone A